MSTLLQSFKESILHDLGVPAAIARWLRQTKAIHVDLTPPKKTINSMDMVRWDRWHGIGGDPGVVQWWGDSGGANRKVENCLREFVEVRTVDSWTCDISNVAGFAASKSELSDFKSTDEMVETNSQYMIEPCNEQKLAENLRWDQIRILRADPAMRSDWFERYSWDGDRVFLINSGGSHHFAAAKYIATRVRKAVPLTGVVKTYRINPLAAEELCKLYEMFVLDANYEFSDFRDAMSSYKAMFGVYGMPLPYKHLTLILFPRSHKRSAKVAAALKKGNAYGFNDYVLRAIDEQTPINCESPGVSLGGASLEGERIPKRERFAEFIRRLEQAPRASSREEALEIMRSTMDEVENELTRLPSSDYRDRMHVFGFECNWKDLDADTCYWDDFVTGQHRTSISHSGKIVITRRGYANPILEKDAA
ncbi:DUF6685 family protein [Paraburkholderia guartelaensis]|uniref:DUF6685 family protein n=1 Tax=Paraburkholderia guartelaensis TaxID=2546446 RepID=UPI002AB778EB|nr:DUF6685 family protein [Paraburkholderia guartelaensis]